jgi:hypothetical protein
VKKSGDDCRIFKKNKKKESKINGNKSRKCERKKRDL